MYLSRFNQLGNRIQEIKGQDLDLNQQQLEQIQKLEQELKQNFKPFSIRLFCDGLINEFKYGTRESSFEEMRFLVYRKEPWSLREFFPFKLFYKDPYF